MAFKRQADWEDQEALEYRPGLRVELKQRPGMVDTIAEYDPMMVPPISLVNDPQPRYPEELNLLPKPAIDWFNLSGNGKIRYAGVRSGSRQFQKALV